MMICSVMKTRPQGRYNLAKLCRTHIEQHGLDDDPDFEASPSEFASALVERGVLAITEDNRYDVAIPSLARWLGITGDGKQASGGRLD